MQTFFGLNTDAGLANLNDYLQSHTYLIGFTPTKTDAFYFHKVGTDVDASRFPHVVRWYSHISSFGVLAFAKFKGEEPTVEPETKVVADDSDSGDSSSSMEIYLGDLDDSDEAEDNADDGDDSDSSSSMEIYLGDLDASDNEAAVVPKDDDADESDSSSMDIFLGDLDAPSDEENKEPQHETVEESDEELPTQTRIVVDIHPPDSETDLELLEKSIKELTFGEAMDWGDKSEKIDIAFGLKKLRLEGVAKIGAFSDNEFEQTISGVGTGELVSHIDIISNVSVVKKKRDEKKHKPEPPPQATDDEDDGSSSASMEIYLGDLDGSDDEVQTKVDAEEEEKEETQTGTDKKSRIVLDIRPYDDECDLELMETLVREITMDGHLTWGQKSERIDIAFGIQNLRLEAEIFDQKCSTSELEEKIKCIENKSLVQGVDFISFVGI